MNDIIPQEALKPIEERFGRRFVQHATGEAGSDAQETFPSDSSLTLPYGGRRARRDGWRSPHE